MAIFNSYVKLPEGKSSWIFHIELHRDLPHFGRQSADGSQRMVMGLRWRYPARRHGDLQLIYDTCHGYKTMVS